MNVKYLVEELIKRNDGVLFETAFLSALDI